MLNQIYVLKKIEVTIFIKKKGKVLIEMSERLI